MTNPTDSTLPDDLSRLRKAHPQWFFTSVWAAAASGPDRRMLVAQRGAVVLSEFTAAALSAKIEREARPEGRQG